MLEISGITIRGPKHHREKKPNQDAIKMKIYKKATVIAIADGFGSCVHSDIGSRTAVLCVHDAYKIWSRSKILDIVYLLKLIHLIWEQKILPYPKSECSTTCLFAILHDENKLYLGLLGDGIIICSSGENKNIINLNSNSIKSFSNQTTGLGVASKISEWKFIETEVSNHFKVMLCSDGVSDDLIEGKEKDFMNYLFDELINLSPKKRNDFLKDQLIHWPTPKHQDDKTLCILWRKI